MTAAEARVWLIKGNLGLVGAEFAFFILAPVLGYPLEYQQAVRLLEIVVPVFVGYLGTAAYSIFYAPTPDSKTLDERGVETGLLVRGPVLIFVFASIIALVAFAISNGPSRQPGSGMSVDFLAGIMTSILSLLTATTGIIIAHLFAVDRKGNGEPQ